MSSCGGGWLPKTLPGCRTSTGSASVWRVRGVVVCLLPARGHLARLQAGRRGRLLAGLGRYPLVGEYVRLARGLGLVSYYDLVAAS